MGPQVSGQDFSVSPRLLEAAAGPEGPQPPRWKPESFGTIPKSLRLRSLVIMFGVGVSFLSFIGQKRHLAKVYSLLRFEVGKTPVKPSLHSPRWAPCPPRSVLGPVTLLPHPHRHKHLRGFCLCGRWSF